MKSVIFAFFAVIALSLSVPALAHHSAARFDLSKSVEMEGVVKKYVVENPHTMLVLEVTDDKGTRTITFEGHSRNNIYRRGWRPGMVEPGDTITIHYGPRRDGKDGGYVQQVTTEDGTSF